jgi:hypothetical protein
MTDTYVYDPARQGKVERFHQAAIELRKLALRASEVAMLLDESSEACSCCSSVRYRNWPQRQLRARVNGASERLIEIAEVFERRANDPEFLDGVKQGGQP